MNNLKIPSDSKILLDGAVISLQPSDGFNRSKIIVSSETDILVVTLNKRQPLSPGTHTFVPCDSEYWTVESEPAAEADTTTPAPCRADTNDFAHWKNMAVTYAKNNNIKPQDVQIIINMKNNGLLEVTFVEKPAVDIHEAERAKIKIGFSSLFDTDPTSVWIKPNRPDKSTVRISVGSSPNISSFSEEGPTVEQCLFRMKQRIDDMLEFRARSMDRARKLMASNDHKLVVSTAVTPEPDKIAPTIFSDIKVSFEQQIKTLCMFSSSINFGDIEWFTSPNACQVHFYDEHEKLIAVGKGNTANDAARSLRRDFIAKLVAIESGALASILEYLFENTSGADQ